MGTTISVQAPPAQVTQKYNNNIINRTYLQVLNQTVNNSVSNVVVNTASRCSATTNLTQNFNLSNMRIGGNLSLRNIEQEQNSIVTFSCVQVNKIKSEMANAMS